MNKLVIDIGNKYLSLSVIEIQQGSNTLLEVVFQDVENKNSNLLARLIKREFTKLNGTYTIDETIVIPRRNHLMHQAITLEYQNTPKEMKDLLLSKVHLPSDDGDYITDWTIQTDCPDEDYQKVFTSSLIVDEFREVSEMIALTGIKKYKIVPSAPNIPSLLPYDGKSYLVMQLGHRVTTFYIVRDGNCEKYLVNREFNGETISNGITTRRSMSNEELYEFKNNLTYIELEDSGAHTELAKCMAVTVANMCDEYVTTEFQSIAGYVVLGGIANLDIEAVMQMSELNMPRMFPRLPVENDELIPGSLRPYLYETFAVLSEPEDGTNLTTPKDKSLGQNIKKVVSIFDSVKIFLNILIIGMVMVMGMNYVQNSVLSSKVTSESGILTAYQNEVKSIKKSVDTLSGQYYELLDDKELAIVNYGETLEVLRDLIPQGSFITNVEDITAEMIQAKPVVVKEKVKKKDDEVELELKDKAPIIEKVQEELLVALKITGYADQRHQAFDYALLLSNLGYDAKITNVETAAEGVFRFEITMVINK